MVLVFIEHLYGTSQKKDAFRGCNSQMFRFQLVRHVESVNIFFWQHLNTSNVALGFDAFSPSGYEHQT